MNDIADMTIWRFALSYLLLLAVLAVMKKCRIDRTRLLVVASARMTVQLVIAGLALTYIFRHPHPLFTILYLLAMTAFAIHRVLSRCPGVNRRFKIAIALSLAAAGLGTVFFFVGAAVGASPLNPRYMIPLSGMIMGNAMTGVTLGMKSFHESVEAGREKIAALLDLGVEPDRILLPFANSALETAILPTLNSMLGMGIVALPGMMTGQILSGTLPTTAILYQISILIAISAVVCLATFSSLHFGYKTLYNNRKQITGM
ncbi:MAG: ABC transporter permease [Planctomycetota bacterium]|jgi:putative ABC transport system permease protein|nr:ABC transporter permease [Planctomycetota bacterium]